MIADAAGWDGLAPDELPPPPACAATGEVVDLVLADGGDDSGAPEASPESTWFEAPSALPPSFRDLAIEIYREAETSGDLEWVNAMPEERAAAVAGRILTVARVVQALEARGYMGPGAQARYEADWQAFTDIPSLTPAVPDDAGSDPAIQADAPTFPEPEDRGTATLSALGEVEYVDDLIRPGRIVVVAAEEGAGKSYAIGGELAIRVAVAGGSFAGTWPVLRTGPVLYLSEMHPDDDYGREATVLASLGLERSALAGRYYRLSLMTAAGGRPPLTVPEWRACVTGWLRNHEALLLIVDTATGATQVDPWGREIQAVYAALRVMLAEYPDLAIVLLIHLKKPQGRGGRRISDVLGEWGRWCDVVILMENEGSGLTRARLTVRKRVRHERRIVVTKAGGLLVDPQDLDETKGTKVPVENVIAAVVAKPGMTYVELGAALGVSKDTASNYVKALGDRLHTVNGTARSGPGARVRVYAIAESPNIAEQARFGDPSAMGAAMEGKASPNAESPYIDRRSASAMPLPARSPAEEPKHRTGEHDRRFDVSDRAASDGDASAEPADLPIEEDYPRSAWDPHAGEDDPGAERPLAEADAGGAT